MSIDKNKIRLMSKMALHDKKGVDEDIKNTQFYRHDFIYKENMKMRFSLGLGCIIVAIFYIIYLLAVEEAVVLALDFQAELIRFVVFVLIVMVVYTLIGTIIFTRKYIASQKRAKAYFALMEQLDNDEDEFEYFEPYKRGEKI
ncbi:MAG: hypothetical protein FWC69_04595 [Defluviitaleaceae bacterium]|nr:hypothetical protein [Defluviitaleaceae bacterium]